MSADPARDRAAAAALRARFEGLPVLACVPAGALDNAELSRRGFGTPVRWARLDGRWIEMVGPLGAGFVPAYDVVQRSRGAGPRGVGAEAVPSLQT